MPLRFKRRVLEHLGHDTYTPRHIRELAADLGVPDADLDDFADAVEQLAEAGQLVYGDNEIVSLPPMGKEVTGVFKRNPKGFGFLVPRDANVHGDLFVPPDATLGALTGDVVVARVVRRKGGGGGAGRSPFTGEIIEIVERKRSDFTGTLANRGSMWVVEPDGKLLTAPVVVRDPGAKNAVEGDKVVFELTRHPEGDTLGEGVLVRVLGKSGEPDVETQAVMAAYSLELEFPEQCVQQARDATRAFDEQAAQIKRGDIPRDRRDMRDDYIITIDPPDAKDFDDAISIERTDRGWRLGVHIADVAHFIPVGSPLDVEAADRGNSVYLPRLVIPMLPEVLSNGICSLQEGVPRFCKSAFMEYDAKGEVRAQGFSQTIIHSAKRLTYLEAQALIEGKPEEAKKHARTEPHYDDRLVETLRDMDRLSRTILDRRMRRGMIRLDLPEVELIFNDEGRVIDAQPEDDAYTHTLIEMFMVEANEALARLFENLGLPLLRRIHPEPAPGDMSELQRFATVAGFRIPKKPSREELQSMLEATRGTPAAKAVHIALLRTLTKAEYSPALVGHFALASEAYAHFTSPIRRYPDLTVHRALAAFLDRTDNGANVPKDEQGMRNLARDMRDDDRVPDQDTLVQIGHRCSQTEQNATDAERELRQFLVLQLLEEHIGEVFDGVVTGVTNGGVFVQLDKYLAEGMIKAADLPGGEGGRVGFWKVDPRSGALVERNTGRSFNIGDRVQAAVSAVDLARRQMELVIADASARDKGKAKKLTLGQAGGGVGHVEGAGFKPVKTGAQKRSQRSKSRDKGKKEHRDEKKSKGKRQ
ncbi:MAG: ribonuclease R [Phycisphaerales bacterium]|nr:MAG: ribonuclease R [Phycisphaerales bacterium]